MSFIHPRIVFYLLGLSLPSQGLSRSMNSDLLLFQTGNVSYKFAYKIHPDFNQEAGEGSSPLLGIRWLHFLREDLAMQFGYENAYSSSLKISQYNETNLGLRYYFLNLGKPIQKSQGNWRLSYSFTIMPYLSTSFAMGESFLRVLKKGKESALVTSHFYGIGLGAGIQLPAYWQTLIDIGLLYQPVSSYGFPEASGSITKIQIALGRHF